MNPHFSRLSSCTKERMKAVISTWKRLNKPAKVLAEGLALLADDKRDPAAELLRKNGTQGVNVATTYGKGLRAKLALEKDEARCLLAVISEIREIEKDEDNVKSMIDMAVNILLDGQKPPSTFSNKSYEKLMGVLAQFEPSVVQRDLF